MRSLVTGSSLVFLSVFIFYGCGSDSGAVDVRPVVPGAAGSSTAAGSGGAADVPPPGGNRSDGGNDAMSEGGRQEDAVAACTSHADCDDLVFCNGSERCDDGVCAKRSPPCDASVCDEGEAACPMPVVDEDDDGDPASSDCDDTDPTRHAGAVEICDAVDNDCDPTTLGPDADGDGVVASGCCNPQPNSAAACGKDCNDADDAVHPEAAETCNGVDDDCDGSVDNAAANAAALCSIAGQTCSAGSCRCPGSQAACNGSCVTLGGGCSDGVGACQRPGVIACLASGPACNAVAANPTPEVCDGVDNDCDGMVDEGMKTSCLADSDGDRYANDASASLQCTDPARTLFGNCPVGYVGPSASLGIDCNAADPASYRLESTSSDADGDGYCSGSAASTCVGTSAPSGRRFTSSCAAGNDCNDSNSGVHTLVAVRSDADGDGYCSGAAFQQCTNGGAIGATRLANSCFGEDCHDGNSQATTSCKIGDGFISTTVRKLCTVGPPPVQTLGVTTATGCPSGFSPSNVRTQVNSSSLPGGNCSANGTSAVTVACGGVVIGWVDCRIVADCVAN